MKRGAHDNVHPVFIDKSDGWLVCAAGPDSEGIDAQGCRFAPSV